MHLVKLSDFLTKALQPVADQRRGQWFANLLHALKPDLLQRMIHLDVDPFYDDSKIWAAVEFVKENWDQKVAEEKNPQNPV